MGADPTEDAERAGVRMTAEEARRDPVRGALNAPFTVLSESSGYNRSPWTAMLDVAFWWCVAVALTGSAGLFGLALLAGRNARSQPRGVRLARTEPLVLRHFGRA